MVFNNRGGTRNGLWSTRRDGRGPVPRTQPRTVKAWGRGGGPQEGPRRGARQRQPGGPGKKPTGGQNGRGPQFVRPAGARAEEELMETVHTQASSEGKKITSEGPRGLISIAGPEPPGALRSSGGITIISQPRVRPAGPSACVSSQRRDRQRAQWEETVIASLGANTMGNSEAGLRS